MRKFFAHPQALVDEGASVGDGTKVWAFAHVCDGVSIGRDCNICDHTFIEKNVVIGDRVTVKCGVYLWDGVIVKNDVFIGPCATFTNDKNPRSKCIPDEYQRTVLENGSSIGANVTLLPGLVIGAYSMVGAGSVVTKDVPEYALVVGAPATRVGWVCKCGRRLSFNLKEAICCETKYSLLNEGVEVSDAT